jgi:predicted nucleic acid-binding protein
LSPAGEVSWLVDKSALVRVGTSPDAEIWADRFARGLVRISPITLLEVGYSARTGDDHRTLTEESAIGSLIRESLTPAIEGRVLEVQRLLAQRGQHRAASIPDLIIAATAELTRLVVLHVDKDFDLIADVTGQAVERLRS